MRRKPNSLEGPLRAACNEFWKKYFRSMLLLHADKGRGPTEPIRDRNLGTTASSHVAAFEQFWSRHLAAAIGVPESEVGKRTVPFCPHRSKSFDVCWPLSGEPRILISIKSMQNAYRNLTNRIEEALGDSAVLRLYQSNAVFGFFFFILDGNVPRGVAEPGKNEPGQIGRKRVPPLLDIIEEGGDFFDLSDVERYRKPNAAREPHRADVIAKEEKSLLDLLAPVPVARADVHYDAVAFLPTRVKRVADPAKVEDAWTYTFSPVNDRLDYRRLLARIIETARLRGFLE